MPSYEDILGAYNAQGRSIPAPVPYPGPFPFPGQQSPGLVFLPPLLGLIRPGLSGPANTPKGQNAGEGEKANTVQGDDGSIEFTLYPLCIAWVPIPREIVESIELLGKRDCQGLAYDFAKITFKLPRTPIEQFVAGLLLQQTSGHSSSQGEETSGRCSCHGKETSGRCSCHDEDTPGGGYPTVLNGCDCSATATVRNGRAEATLRCPPLFSIPIPFPVDVPGVPDGEQVEIRLHLCGANCTKGARVEAYWNGSRVYCRELMGNCDC